MARPKKPTKQKRTQTELEPWQDPDVEPYIVVEGLSKDFDGVPAVQDCHLEVYKGEFFSLLGASGCGKSTLLRMLAGFETPSSGKLFIGGQDMTCVPPNERPVNMMFQSYALFPHMTVEQNVAFGLKMEGVAGEEIRDRVYEVLDLVKMTKFAKRRPNRLSGGQCQRVALARSLVKRPKLLLLDEPMAALDQKLREETQFELVNIQEQVGITFIMVTHDQEEAMTVSTRLGIMEDGYLQQVGTPHEIYEFPNSTYVADFIGSINMFEGVVTEETKETVKVESPVLNHIISVPTNTTVPLGAAVTIAIRPEKIMVGTEKPSTRHNWEKGIIEDIGYYGDMSIYHVRLDSNFIVMAALPNLDRLAAQPMTWEQEVYISWHPENSLILLR